jgi:hypothetical protein
MTPPTSHGSAPPCRWWNSLAATWRTGFTPCSSARSGKLTSAVGAGLASVLAARKRHDLLKALERYW